ncbi:MAG: bifunctional glycosyltransferase family 2/GtrA family protein [Lachnospiraceae bacterium]|nr:bifunctional glycosyltransferase family 2/GtrA family protein [Candidatus Colinaster scatohippi]
MSDISNINFPLIEEKIVLIIPAYEPDDRLSALLEELRKDFHGRIVIVNDGSGAKYDKYYETAKDYGCVVLNHFANMGKGRALKNAFNYCLNEYPGITGCVTADSDGQHLPEDIYRVMQELCDNDKCLILGCRDFSHEDVPFRSKLGNGFMKGACRFMCGVNASDTQTGLRGIPADFMTLLLNTEGERFEFETRMLLDARDRYPLKEVIIQTVYESKENHQSHYNTFKDSVRIGRILAGVFVKFVISSLSSTVVDLLIFNALCPLFKPVTALYYITIATVIARVISAVYNYTINYKIVFKSKDSVGRSAVKYFALALIQMCLSALFTTVGVFLIPILPETLIKAIVDVCLFFISYGVQRTIVFK